MKTCDSKWLARFVQLARKSSLVARWKHLLPQSFRQASWRIAVKQEIFNVSGSRMFVPADARNRSIVLDEYEPALANKIKSLLRPGMTFCDVGANLGVFTLLAAKIVGISGRVVAFEPVPNNYNVLCHNIALNGYNNVTAWRKAVSDRSGTAQIHLSKYCGSHSLISDPAQATGQFVDVELVRLDSLSELRHLDLIKIDTEGTELAVLRSLGSINPRHILLECNTERLQKGGVTGMQFLNELEKMGFNQIENLDEPDVGLSAIKEGLIGSWNLYAISKHE